MNVFKYFWILVTTAFDSAGDHTEIKAALLLLVLIGFILGFVVGLVVSALAKRKSRI